MSQIRITYLCDVQGNDACWQRNLNLSSSSTRFKIPHMEVTLETDPETGDLVLPLPEFLFEKEGWRLGDRLKFEVREKKNGALIRNLSWEERQRVKGPGN